MLTAKQQNIIKKITAKYDPVLLGIFGSYARSEQNKDSDIDILVDFRKEVNLLDLIGIEQELSKLLGKKVDLITLRSLNKRLAPYIKKDLIRII